jgi:response regulator RpfG family c-di-GMP phosphodiesterase
MVESAESVPAGILVVDDDREILDALSEQLEWAGYAVARCATPQEGLEALEARTFAVVISDQNMPEMTGLEFLARAQKLQPNSSRILITGILALDTAVSAINQGDIFRFLAKPWVRAELLATMENAVQRYRLIEINERLRKSTLDLNRQLAGANSELRAKVSELTAQKTALDAAHEALEENFEHSLGLCYRIINTFYPLLGKRTKAVVEICRKMSESAVFSAEEKHVLVTSAWLHDIGLVGVKREILHKLFSYPQGCTEAELAMFHQHPIYGQTLAAFVDRLTSVGVTIRAHHERFDGKGYPDGLVGEAIPWTGRCLGVAVAFVESGLSKEAAGEYLLKHSGTAFDPEAVRLCLRVAGASMLPAQVRELLIDELRPGMKLARGIFSPGGLLLIADGQELTPAIIAKIKNYNLLAHVTQQLLVYS